MVEGRVREVKGGTFLTIVKKAHFQNMPVDFLLEFCKESKVLFGVESLEKHKLTIVNLCM